MFNKPYDTRLSLWREFRQSLETCDDPIQRAIDFYSDAPTVTLNADPWDKATWPDPWELLKLNEYCDFTRVMGIGYSLQLTERFSGNQFEIHIYTHNNKGYVFLLVIDNNHVIGWEKDMWTKLDELPIKDLRSQHIHSFPKHQ